MACSLTVLLALTTSIVAEGQTCNTVTSGKCAFIGCYQSRGAVDCVGAWPNKVCQCKPGFCTTDDKASCVNPNGTSTPPWEGDRVEVQDRESDVPLPGKVTSISPLEVQPDGCKESFAWKIVKHEAPAYKKGDEVEARDEDSDSWKRGTVTSISDSGVRVQPDGWKQSFTFGQIRTTDFQKREQEAAAAHEKARGQFAAALQQATADAAAAKKASAEATTVATQASKEAQDTQKATDEAGVRLKNAEAVQVERQTDEANANAHAEEASAKEDAAHQATAAADKARDNAATEAAKAALASKAAQENGAKKKAAVQAEQAHEAQDKDAITATCAEQPSPAMQQAMAEACKSAKAALNATQKLLDAYQSAQANADKMAAAAAAGSQKAQKEATLKKGIAADAAHDEAQEKSGAQTAAQAFSATKKVADSATNSAKELAAAAGAAKKVSDVAAVKAKESAANADQKMAAANTANAAAADTGKKNQAIFGKSATFSAQTQFVLLQNTEPNNYDNSSMLVVTGLFAALAMFAAVVWRSTRLSGNIVMPESLLG